MKLWRTSFVCWCWILLLWCSGCAGSSRDAKTAAAESAPTQQPGYGAPGVGGPNALYGEADAAEESAGTGSDDRLAQAPAGRPARATPMPPVTPPTTAPPPSPDDGSSATTQPKALAGPLLIYSAHVHLAVFEAAQAIDRAERLAKEAGGYLVRRDDRTITVRVPAAGFHGALDGMLTLGDVLHRNVSVRDVTEEFYDVQIRIRNAELVRERLEQLLARAQRVEEALAVERELERVAGEVERLKGRLKLLSELLAFSTITLEFQPRATENVERSVNLPFPWLQQLGLGQLLSL
jgi:hypothetical protein